MVDKNKFAEEESQGYRLEIVGRNVLVTEAIKNYVLEKLSKIQRFHTHILDLRMTIEAQKLEQVVSIVLRFEHFKIKVQASTTDMYASIDLAIDKLQTQLRRWKERIQDHQRTAMKTIDMMVNVIRKPFNELEEFNADITLAEKEQEKMHAVIKTEKRPLKELTQMEAIMKMELSGDYFLVFRSEEDRKLKVIYRRDDGDYGIIQAE